jgi:cytosine/adenosine deaminase-related metal-dependent hydrolase
VVDGRIAALGSPDALRGRYPKVGVRDLGDSILAPGFVDAHCHLEWALTAGLAPGGEFGRWLGAFLAAVATAGPEVLAASADAGALAALRAGTTTLYDSGPTGAGAAALTAMGLRGVSCVEAFGAGEAGTLGPSLERLRAGIARAEAAAGPRVRVGVSPHAPYSVGPALWKILTGDPDLGARAWSTHFAESAAELEAIATGHGTIAEALGRRDVHPARWPGPDGTRVITRLSQAGALRPGMVAAHCVQLDEHEPALLAAHGVAVAHCPISNARLGCGAAPLGALAAAGVRIGLGTDSPGSAGNYDIRAEARACELVQGAVGTSLTPHELVRLATIGGAEALGCDQEIGSISVGKYADLVALRPPGHVAGADAHLALLDPQTLVTHVWIEGQLRIDGARALGIDVEGIATRAEKARRVVC